MGATIHTQVFDPGSSAEVLKKIKIFVEENRRKYGQNFYSGYMTSLWPIKVCDGVIYPTEQAAVEACDDLEKGTALLAHLLDGRGTTIINDATRALYAARGNASTRAQRLIEEHIATIRTGKTQMRRCRACGSSIATRFLRPGGTKAILSCPICHDPEFLTTARLTLQLTKIEQHIAAAQQAYDQACAQQIAAADPGPLPWVLVMCCPC